MYSAGFRCTVTEQRFADGPILAVDVPRGTVDRVPEIDHGQPLRLRVTPETFVDGNRRDCELPSDTLDYVHAGTASAKASHVPVACFGRLPGVEQRAGQRIGEVLTFIATQPGGQNMRKLVGHPELEVVNLAIEIQVHPGGGRFGKMGVQRVLVPVPSTPEHGNQNRLEFSESVDQMLEVEHVRRVQPDLRPNRPGHTLTTYS